MLLPPTSREPGVQAGETGRHPLGLRPLRGWGRLDPRRKLDSHKLGDSPFEFSVEPLKSLLAGSNIAPCKLGMLATSFGIRLQAKRPC